MGYYTIDILPWGQDMDTIVTEFGKLRYNRIPMGMCISEDILQAKLYKIPGDIEGVKTSINVILVLNNDSFSNNIY